MNITFCELRTKDVVNIVDGKKMGRVVDLVFCCDGCKVLGIVLPGERRLFRSKDDIFVPWSHIQKIGSDCVLINLIPASGSCPPGKTKPKPANCDYIIDDEY